LPTSALILEAVPEVKQAKQEIFAWLDQYLSQQCIVASTTSTFLVTDIAQMISHPERVVNAHWLNPAYLMPLVELSRSDQTSNEVLTQLKQFLQVIGKVPVVCNAKAGYIVPRIQALAMNEAARMVEDGVASAEDIDIAIRTGFGLRFSVLGLLEFIDWGGGDILYYASQYLQKSWVSVFVHLKLLRKICGSSVMAFAKSRAFIIMRMWIFININKMFCGPFQIELKKVS
jgi:3-hydroxybutyryl-CoA dehydrogenase